MPDLPKLTVTLLCPFVFGCTPASGIPDMMDDYVHDLAASLELESSLSDVAPVPQIPRRRERFLDLPDLELGMLDFLSLYGCELQYVVGERNSIMGKVMQPLNRLRYEASFIRAAEDCIPEAEREGVKETLEEAIESKSKTLPIALWNATWGVEEVERLFTLAQGYYPLSDDAGNPVAGLASDVRQLNESVAGLLAGNPHEPLDYVGEVHQRWQAEHRAGQLLNSARLLTTRLNDASALLIRRIESESLCPGGNGDGLRGAVKAVYSERYLGGVAGYLETVQQGRNELIEPLETLAIQQAGSMPEAFRTWYSLTLDTDHSKSLWAQLDRAAETHARRWQQLREQCLVEPGP